MRQPDVAAPGVNILAAYSPLRSYVDGGYAVKSGTSLSTPHVSGIVALLKVMHPSWSPAAIRSALVTTGIHNSLGQFHFNDICETKLYCRF